MVINIDMPQNSPWDVENLALLLKGKREQHHLALAESNVHVEMNSDFIHGFATALAFTEFGEMTITPDELPQRITEWYTAVMQILDNLDDLT